MRGLGAVAGLATNALITGANQGASQLSGLTDRQHIGVTYSGHTDCAIDFVVRLETRWVLARTSGRRHGPTSAMVLGHARSRLRPGIWSCASRNCAPGRSSGIVERRRRVDQCLFAVVMEAYLHGTSTRKVDDLVKALGADTGISKSEVSRICADLDTEVAAFRDRSLADQRFPYVFLDATYCKARVNHRVVSQAVVIATGVAADGRREVLGFDVGDSEDGAFWHVH